MTFYGRLRLFFTIIVIFPMLAIAAVLFTLTADSERGKADAGIATGVSVAFSEYDEARAAAQDDLRRAAADTRLRRALSDDDPQAARALLAGLARADPAIVSATLTGPGGERVARVGSRRGVAAALASLVSGRGGRRLGTLAVSVTDARALAASAARRARRSSLEVMVLRDGKPVATTVPEVRTIAPGSTDFDAGGRDYRGRREVAGRPAGVTEEIAVFREAGDLNSAISDSRLLIGAIIAAFLLLALATSVFVVRALQGQIGQFLAAARRLASGRFDQRVPIEGRDEFAQLGREFNSMSEQLKAKIDELEGKRRELEGKRRELEATIRRVGKAVASGLDRQGVVELTVQTALHACEAESGRALPMDGRVLQETRAGAAEPRLVAALEEAERAAFSVGAGTRAELLEPPPGGVQRVGRQGPTAIEREGVHALALPLRARLGSRAYASYVGVISIARRERRFTSEDAELLEYLAGQAVISIENVDLHEMVQKQAITDELTGLANLREMHGALDREFERLRRFETPLGFVLLDLDDFKHVNDSFGHQQGDEVLVEVANVLRELTRDIDEPARYGGEELAVVLPQTDVEGAALLAERMREAIDRLRVPRLGGGGEALRVTASFGVAAVPASATDKEGLIAAADAALYRAKRAGKNRIERARPVGAGAGRTSDG
ncbi:MAG: diguanylate cyclase [Thermoleophilaceae bacterium]